MSIEDHPSGKDQIVTRVDQRSEVGQTIRVKNLPSQGCIPISDQLFRGSRPPRLPTLAQTFPSLNAVGSTIPPTASTTRMQRGSSSPPSTTFPCSPTRAATSSTV